MADETDTTPDETDDLPDEAAEPEPPTDDPEDVAEAEKQEQAQAGVEGDGTLASYAAERGLELHYRRRLPPVTPLLRQGDRRFANAVLRGKLAPHIQGRLALYTRVDIYRDSNGRRHRSMKNFTLCLTHVPRAKQFVPRLLCERKSGLRALEGLEDKVLHSDDRVKFESAKLDEHYEIFVSPEHDENWLRQLFEPSFIVWLTDEAPSGLAFEYEQGRLVVSLEDHHTEAAELDALRDATITIVRRFRQEIRESLGKFKKPGQAPGIPPRA